MHDLSKAISVQESTLFLVNLFRNFYYGREVILLKMLELNELQDVQISNFVSITPRIIRLFSVHVDFKIFALKSDEIANDDVLKLVSDDLYLDDTYYLDFIAIAVGAYDLVHNIKDVLLFPEHDTIVSRCIAYPDNYGINNDEEGHKLLYSLRTMHKTKARQCI